MLLNKDKYNKYFDIWKHFDMHYLELQIDMTNTYKA